MIHEPKPSCAGTEQRAQPQGSDECVGEEKRAGWAGSRGNKAALCAPGRTLGFACQGGCDGSLSSKTHWDFDASSVWPSHSSPVTLLARWYQKHFLIKLLLTGQGNLAPHDDK